MKKQYTSYQLSKHYFPVKEKPIRARKDMAFEIKLAARLMIDEAIYLLNKKHLQSQIDRALDYEDTKEFKRLSAEYVKYVKHE